MEENFNPNIPQLTPITNSLPEYGDTKRLPSNLELEAAVLGCMLVEHDVVSEIIDIINDETFFDHKHQKIFMVIKTLFTENLPIEPYLVGDKLTKMGLLNEVGGYFYLSELTNRAISSANIESYARILVEKQIQRALIKSGNKIIRDAFNDKIDAFDLLNTAEEQIFAITQNNIKKNFNRLSDLLFEVKKQIQKSAEQKEGLSGVPSGFTALDRVTAGFQNSDLIVMAARPGMGKTSFVLSLARNIALNFNRPVAFFSLEMGATQIVSRLLAAETQLGSDKLRRGRLADYEWELLDLKMKDLEKAPIYIDDSPALSILEFRAKARRLKSKHDVELIIIDYLQLMTGGEKGMNREQEISQISRSLKAIAKELNVPIIALAQLSRAVEQRSSKIPQLSDLRESGAIEQDADIVIFIHRPEYYGLTEDNGQSLIGLAELHIAKHRNGSLEKVNLRWEAHLSKFSDYGTDIEHDSSFNPTSSSYFGDDQVIGSKAVNSDFPASNIAPNTNFDFLNNDTVSPF